MFLRKLLTISASGGTYSEYRGCMYKGMQICALKLKEPSEDIERRCSVCDEELCNGDLVRLSTVSAVRTPEISSTIEELTTSETESTVNTSTDEHESTTHTNHTNITMETTPITELPKTTTKLDNSCTVFKVSSIAVIIGLLTSI